LDRIEEALVKTTETADLLLEEVVIDGEMTVPGAAAKLANRLKTLFDSVEFPEEITYASVEELIQDLEGYIRDVTMAGHRYIRRLPQVHKRVVKELDYQFRAINQGYQKIKKIWEKDKLPKQLDQIRDEVEEIEDRSHQVVKLSTDLVELQQQQEKAEGRIEKQQTGIEQFRKDSGLEEIEEIRREIDSIRMIVTNQLNFLKKPFKKLSQAAGQSIMISSTAGEGADAYSADPWQAFQRDTDNLTRLKAGLNALADAIEEKKIKFKASLNRKVIDRRDQVIEKGALDDYRLRFSTLDSRKSEIESSVSIDERRELEKSLERAEWEKRDVAAEIAHHEEQVAKVSARLKTLQTRLEKSLSKILRGDIEIEFPDEVRTLIGEDLTDES
jgi:chromosome segregation ATPase